MVSDDPVREVANVFTGGAFEPAQALRQLTELVMARLPHCAGVTATLWEPDEVVATTATHPDLAALAERQFAAGDGPTIAAMRTGEPSVTADTLREDRWPDWSAAALAAGVRSSTTIFCSYDSMSLTLSLYGVRRGALDPQQLPLATLLAAFGTAIMAGAAEVARARRTTVQLEEAVRSRAVVDQAKGVLIQALGCDPDEAFDRLRHISQTEHIKVTTVARMVVENGHEEAGRVAGKRLTKAPGRASSSDE